MLLRRTDSPTWKKNINITHSLKMHKTFFTAAIYCNFIKIRSINFARIILSASLGAFSRNESTSHRAYSSRDRIESSVVNDQSLLLDVIAEMDSFRDFDRRQLPSGIAPVCNIIMPYYSSHRFWFYHHRMTSGVNHAWRKCQGVGINMR